MNKVRYDVCPCDSQKSYLSCCEPFITGKQSPETPEALMRSRYTAYTMANIDYIKETMRGNALTGFQEMDAKRWAKRVHWIKLNVLKSVIENTSTGYVIFEASFVDGSRLKSIHEKLVLSDLFKIILLYYSTAINSYGFKLFYYNKRSYYRSVFFFI